MSYTNLEGADLTGAHLESMTQEGTVYHRACLRSASLVAMGITNADFSGADLQGIKYDMVALQNFARSKMDGARMSPELQKDLEKMRSDRA